MCSDFSGWSVQQEGLVALYCILYIVKFKFLWMNMDIINNHRLAQLHSLMKTARCV